MKNRVGIIGKFGTYGSWVDGQTIKTKNLAKILEKTGKYSFVKVDTCYFKKNNLKLLVESLRCIATCDHIFLLVSVNGMKFYLPFLYYLNKVFHRRIYHYIIGSELLEMVRKDPGLVKYLNALTENWFEYDSGTRYLQAQGVLNVSTLPNFKSIEPVDTPLKYNDAHAIAHFCTFSRVMEEKGITEAAEMVGAVNRKYGRVVATLDIYGQVEETYMSKLQEVLCKHKGYVAYRGVIDSQSSVNVLKNYFALLFPTRWVGEGFPGTIIDAFASGIPVIASDWNANKEIIQHKVQGIIYPNDEMRELEDAICWAIQHTEEMAQMREDSRKAFERYTPDAILQVILSKMDESEGAAR